jgi:hypothetical protein
MMLVSTADDEVTAQRAVLVLARHAVINENESNRLWRSAGGETENGSHVPHPSIRK